MEVFNPTPKKPTLLLDFDGVIHSYTSGWIQHNVIPDDPVPGAFDFIEDALGYFKVCIYSSRSREAMGIEAMRSWFLQHGLHMRTIVQLEFPTEKPAAFLTIDDRCICFQGTFPNPASLTQFRTWQQRRLPVDDNETNHKADPGVSGEGEQGRG